MIPFDDDYVAVYILYDLLLTILLSWRFMTEKRRLVNFHLLIYVAHFVYFFIYGLILSDIGSEHNLLWWIAGFVIMVLHYSFLLLSVLMMGVFNYLKNDLVG